MRGQIDGDHIDGRLRRAGGPGLLKADAELLLVDSDTQIAEVAVIVIFEQESLGRDGGFCVEVLAWTRASTSWPPSPQTMEGPS